MSKLLSNGCVRKSIFNHGINKIILTLIMLNATKMSNTNILNPDETPINSASHPDPNYVTRRLHIHQFRIKSEHPENFEAGENWADDNFRNMIRVEWLHEQVLYLVTEWFSRVLLVCSRLFVINIHWTTDNCRLQVCCLLMFIQLDIPSIIVISNSLGLIRRQVTPDICSRSKLFVR